MTINVDMKGENFVLMTHLMAGHLLNAYYSAMILKRMSGEAFSPEMAGKTAGEVTELYFSFLHNAQQHFLKQSGVDPRARD